MSIKNQLLFIFLLLQTLVFAQSDTLKEATILANWANSNTPMAFDNVSKKALQKNNIGQDMPYLLQQLPSVIASSDAGTGIGYTNLRVRGTDATRINVTINGVPLNDAESQAVYWVNMPDFATSVSNVQLQRGVGTSTNGAGAFGATLNLNTSQMYEKPYATLTATAGSFGTRKASLQFGTGLLNEHFTFDARVSKIQSDGYIQRATANLGSWFTSAAYIGKRNSLRLNVWSGHERTYHAWNGVPIQLANDKKLRTTNTAGTEKEGAPYENQIDNYTQKHLQLIYNQQVSQYLSYNVTAHATLGSGYYEEYKANQNLKDYTLNAKDSTMTDVVRRRWLSNIFAGALANMTYQKGKLTWVNGAAINQYVGDHFGEAIWAKGFDLLPSPFKYYLDRAKKTDISFYSKANYRLSPKLNVFADLQIRHVKYQFFDRKNETSEPNILTFSKPNTFVNPKFGLMYNLDNQQDMFASFAVANKEPNRDDYRYAAIGSTPQNESLYDTELGYTLRKAISMFRANAYFMYYKNQLAITGVINENSQPVRVNVPNSYRVGIELQYATNLSAQLQLSANVTFSQNKIVTFTEYFDNWEKFGQESKVHKNTNLALSPNAMSSTTLTYLPFGKNADKADNLQISLVSRYVSKQYLDNTSDEKAVLKAYFVQDFKFVFAPNKLKKYNVECNLLVNNIWNTLYSNNGWSYRFRSDSYNPIPDDKSATKGREQGIYNLIGYYPQAGTHFLLAVKVGI